MQKEGVEALHHLIDICKDGEKGFLEAAQGLHPNSELRMLCFQYSKERGQFARELEKEVEQFQERPAPSGTLTGMLHRGWIDLKAAVTAHDEDAIIAECERGEDAAKEAYAIALAGYLPAQSIEGVKHQYKKVVQSHNRFSVLKKTVAN